MSIQFYDLFDLPESFDNVLNVKNVDVFIVYIVYNAAMRFTIIRYFVRGIGK
jgi:hypothetical protein